MEMAVEVKRSLPPREEKILVAIDVAIRNIEKLSVITALCHQLLENQDFTSFSTPSQSLETLLGREIHEILKTIVSFLKPSNKSNANKELAIACSHKSDFGKTKRNTVSKQDLIFKLKQNREKREFLQKVMRNAKIFLENKKLLISTSTASSLIPSNACNNSVVGLLREALTSIYKDDVRQAIRDLDVESLTSIFYLMEFADDKPEAPSKFSITFDEEMESFYNLRSPSSTESDKSDYLMHLGTEPEDGGEDEEENPNLGFEKSITKYHDYENFADPTDKEESLKANLRDLILHSSPPLIAEEVKGLHCKLLAYEFPSQFYSIVNDGNKELHELLKCMKELRFFASQYMATSRPRPTKLSIEHQLLVIQQRKLQVKLTKLKEKEEEQQGRLDAQLFEWSKKCDKAQEEVVKNIKCSIKEHLIEEAKKEKGFQRDIGRISENLKTVTGSLSDAVGFVKQCTKRLRARRHFLEASSEGLIREYDSTMLKYQREIDDLGIVEMNNAREIDALQVKFKNVEEQYDEMKAMRRLKEILQNMEKAEALKQHWAARKIQMAWRRYKVAKLRKKKLKGRKKGKKKTPPPQQGKASSPPSKSSGTTSRSKSQTP